MSSPHQPATRQQLEVLLLCTLEEACSAEPSAVAVAAVAVIFLLASEVMVSECHALITVSHPHSSQFSHMLSSGKVFVGHLVESYLPTISPKSKPVLRSINTTAARGIVICSTIQLISNRFIIPLLLRTQAQKI